MIKNHFSFATMIARGKAAVNKGMPAAVLYCWQGPACATFFQKAQRRACGRAAPFSFLE